MAAVRARWIISPRTERESPLSFGASFLPLIHHHRYSTMRGYQYPLTDTDVGQLVASDRQHFHLGCRITVNGVRERSERPEGK